MLLATGGTLTLQGTTTGVGQAVIRHAGTLDAQGTFNENVTFYDTGDMLRLAHAYTGVITGFAASDTITYSAAATQPTSAIYASLGNGLGRLTLNTGDVLTLAGDYSASRFVVTAGRYHRQHHGRAQGGAGARCLPVHGHHGPRLRRHARGRLQRSRGQPGPAVHLARHGQRAIAATIGNVFLHGGAGRRCTERQGRDQRAGRRRGVQLPGGRQGTDGGTDTFFVDGRSDGATWSTVANFHHGDAMTLWGFQDGVSTRPWTALEGATGYQGATIHSELGGAGTGVNASVTFAGISQADALAKFTVRPARWEPAATSTSPTPARPASPLHVLQTRTTAAGAVVRWPAWAAPKRDGPTAARCPLPSHTPARSRSWRPPRRAARRWRPAPPAGPGGPSGSCRRTSPASRATRRR